MNHVDDIRSAIKTVVGSSEFHAVLIEGPAGWGKTTTVTMALDELNLESIHLGSYSTPLNLFNFFSEHQNDIILIDDTAGLFENPQSMSLLKSATWSNNRKKRVLKWGSTSNKVLVDSFEFHGKLIIVCNQFPKTSDARAVRSRSLPQRIDVSVSQAKKYLIEASKSKEWFEKPKLSEDVGHFICGNLNEMTLRQINFRSLKMGYELALANPENWKYLLSKMLGFDGKTPEDLVQELALKYEKIGDQERAFEELTGLKRRSFYLYRRKLQISKDYTRR